MIPDLPYEKLRVALLPVFHSLNGRSLPQRFLRNVVIVQMAVALDRGLQIVSGVKAVGGEHLAAPAVELLNYPVGLRVAYW